MMKAMMAERQDQEKGKLGKKIYSRGTRLSRTVHVSEFGEPACLSVSSQLFRADI
jgi:hypothetical protein